MRALAVLDRRLPAKIEVADASAACLRIKYHSVRVRRRRPMRTGVESLKGGCMTDSTGQGSWATAAVLAGRLIFTAMFLFAVSLKLMNVGGTAGQIAAAGFPLSSLLVWCAIGAELALVLAFATGAYFREAALFGAVYVLFLGFSFHGPSHWAANQDEFGFFIDHFTFAAGLLFASAHGPGRVLALHRTWFA